MDSAAEAQIRTATHRAIQTIANDSGCSIAAIDGFFFVGGRTVCVETEQPLCERCPLLEDCARETALFQPVFRTTDY